MADEIRVPVPAPRIGANDDVLRVVRVLKADGDVVHSGEAVVEIASDKATVVVEAPMDGRIASVCVAEEQTIEVDAPLMWITSEQRVSVAAPARSDSAEPRASSSPTAKARILLARHGLDASSIAFAGARMKADDVLAHLGHAARQAAGTAAPSQPSAGPGTDTRSVALSAHERAMLRAIDWHHREAVPAYVEVPFDAVAWRACADEFRSRNNLLFDPLLAILVWRLARIAAEQPRLNSAVIDRRRLIYGSVNVGVTVQTDGRLYLVVVRGAERLSPREVFDQLADLQRRAINGALSAADITDATIGFTSMARWEVRRHVPVLPPHTSLIVAHSAEVDANGWLGATYDHRSLTGGDVAAALGRLVIAPSALELPRWMTAN